MRTETFDLRTGSTTVTDITARCQAFARAAGGDGLLHVFLPHATAGLALLETGAGTEPDLERALREALPRDDRWVHRHGARGHGADHVLPALVSPSLSVPVIDGEMALGTWQSVVVVDTNADNPDRTVRLSFLAG